MKKLDKRLQKGIPDIWDSMTQHNLSLLFKTFSRISRILLEKWHQGDTTLSEQRAVANFLADIGAIQFHVKSDDKNRESWATVEVHYKGAHQQNTSDVSLRLDAEVIEEQTISTHPARREITDAAVPAVSGVKTEHEPTDDINRDNHSSVGGDDFDNDDDVDLTVPVQQNEQEGAVFSEVQSEVNTQAAVLVHKCMICGSFFPNTWELDLHVYNCELKSATNLFYNCYLCEKHYKARWKISVHLRRAHDVPTSEIVEKLPSLRGPPRPPSKKRKKKKADKKRKQTANYFDKPYGVSSNVSSRRATLRKKANAGSRLVRKGSIHDRVVRMQKCDGKTSLTSTEPSSKTALTKRYNTRSRSKHLHVGEDDRDLSIEGKHDAENDRSSFETIDSRGEQSESSTEAPGFAEEGDASGAQCKEQANKSVEGQDTSDSIEQSESSTEAPGFVEEGDASGAQCKEQASKSVEGQDPTDADGSFQEGLLVENDSNKEILVSPLDSLDQHGVPDTAEEVRAAEEVHVKEVGVSNASDQERDEEGSKTLGQEEVSSQDLSTLKHSETVGTEKKNKERSNKEANKLSCHLCGETLQSRSLVRNHVKKVHFQDSFKCNTCGKEFGDKSCYKVHIESHSRRAKKPDGPFVCNVCSRIFKNEYFYGRHLEEHKVYGDSLTWKCEICHVILSSKGSLTKHMNSRHTKDKKFPCTHCDKVFYLKHYLTNHLREHTGSKTWKCDHCDQAYYQRHQLESHKKNVHHNNQHFLCDLCGSKYKSLGNLKQHHLTAHTDTFAFSCDQCGKKFKRRSHLNHHLKVHLNIRPHKCHLCEKSFRTRKNLTVHIDWHNNVRAFKCSVCDKAFLTKCNLDKHMQKHQEAKAYFCTECDYGCADFTSLRKHLSVVHNIVVESKVTQTVGISYRRGARTGTKNLANTGNTDPAEDDVDQARGPADEQVTAASYIMLEEDGCRFPSSGASESLSSDAPVSSASDVPGSCVRESIPSCEQEGQDIATQAFMTMMLS